MDNISSYTNSRQIGNMKSIISHRKMPLFKVISMCFLMLVTQFVPVSAQTMTADAPNMPFGEYLSARHALANKQYDIAAENYFNALKLDPENVPLNLRTLAVLVMDGRFDDAIMVAHRLQSMGQDNEISRLMLFFEKIKERDYEEALLSIDELSSANILHILKPNFKGWILAEQGKKVEVEEIVQGFEQGTTFRFFNFFQSGLLFEYLGDLEQAELYYSKALAEPGLLNLRAVEAYGGILIKQGKSSEAEAIFRDYLEDTPSNEQLKAGLSAAQNGNEIQSLVTSIDEGFAELFYTVATILMQDNVKEVATSYLQHALYFRDEFPLAHFLQAQIFESDEYYEGASKHFNLITNDSPLYFQSKIQRAWLLNDMDQDEAAIAAFEALEKEYPNNREVLNSIAEYYRTHERYAEAIPAYNRVVGLIDEDQERDWVLYYTRGIVFDQEKRWPEAESDFKKALELRPEQPMVLNYLAYSWVDQGINYDEAKVMLERAVELRPNDGYIVDSLGWALFKMGENEEAVKVLERAAQLQTQDWAINDHLGDVYWTVGRKNEARFQWRHALSLNPDEDKIEGIRNKIEGGYIKSF